METEQPDVKEATILNENKVLCVVPDDELTGAIGKVGENVTLASELIGIDITIKGWSKYQKEKVTKHRKKIKVKDLQVNDRVKKLLLDAGCKNAQNIMSQSKEELMEIKGLGTKSIDKIYKSIHKIMNREI